MKRSAHLTPGEFELIEILWPLGEASVKDVWTRVNPDRGLAYTTVMTVLEKMYRKGILTQSKRGKAFRYSAALSREQVLKWIVEHLCEVYFAGSYAELANFVSKQYAASAQSKPAIEKEQSKSDDPTA